MKIDADGEKIYPTNGLAKSRVVRAGLNDWVRTSTPSPGLDWGFFFKSDDGTSHAGPALLVGHDTLTPVDGGGSGVRDVVQLGDETWLLTNVDRRVGPARRWHQ